MTRGRLKAIAAEFQHELSAPMLEWCHRLATPDLCEWVKAKRTSDTILVRGIWAGMEVPHELDARMLAAGLIHYEQRVLGACSLDESIEYVAVLTEAGWSVGDLSPLEAACAVTLFDETP